MKNTNRQKIVLLGCGNLAWHLARQFHALDSFSVYVYNHRQNTQLTEFKTKFKCKVEVGFEHVIQDADFYFICVADQFVSETAKRLSISNPRAIILHTAGSLKIKELGKRIQGIGVFYPLQTFSRGDKLDWQKIPIIIEASDKETTTKIKQLAIRFSNVIAVFSYNERLRVHLAAVFVNNFANALYVAAQHLLQQKGNDNGFKLLLPLIEQTTAKLSRMSPQSAQTGPAKRKDVIAMKNHLTLLKEHNDLKKIYKQLSKLIDKQQHSNDAKF